MKNKQQDKTFNTPLERAYYDVPAYKQIEIRNRIIEECGIAKPTFYSWLKGKSQPKLPAQKVISEILNIPETVLFQSK